MEKLNLNENFISRIWENPSYYKDIRTTDGRLVEILDHGKRNMDSGPDYKNAKVNIHNVIYSGDIEIHRTMSDWKAHRHKGDGKYNKVILQVVMWADEKEKARLPKAKKSREIPTIILSEFLTSSIHNIWKEIIDTPSERFTLPCYPEGTTVDDNIKKSWVEELSIERLRYKTRRIKSRLERMVNLRTEKAKWEQMLFEFICEALGYSKNKEQFRKLSEKIDVNKVKRLKLSRMQLDALMFGTAGFMKELRYKDEYITKLKKSREEVRKKLNIESVDKSEWHFFRLRPANFPTLRLAYASALLYEMSYSDFFKEVVLSFEKDDKPAKRISEILSSIEPNPYWREHYNFGKVKKTASDVSIGKDRITNIHTNVILPMLFLYSKVFNKKELEDKVLDAYLFTKKTSGNEVTKVMERQLDFRIRSISQEQGMIQLHNFYCIKGRCNQCKIGKEVFGSKINEPLKIILY
ncbi:MAG: DUF2851 family protein [Ignavibacteriae bacterium]|nr:DUF2851 family protein [Ignavibacteriota bacterium]